MPLSWENLFRYKDSLRNSYAELPRTIINVPKSRFDLLNEIEQIFLGVLNDFAERRSPTIHYISRDNWKNVVYDKETGVKLDYSSKVSRIDLTQPRSVKRFAMFMDILTKVYQHIFHNSITTKRDIYYENPSFYSSQDLVDNIIDDIACKLRVTRRLLHIASFQIYDTVTMPKCLVAGLLSFKADDGMRYEYFHTRTGLSIPVDVHAITSINSKAEFILIIEKEAVFLQFLESDLNDLPPHIALTGKGFPDLATRQFVKLLSDTLKIPTFVLVDGDPHGIEIMFTYRFGSLSSSYDVENLAVPAIRWIGLHCTDLEALSLHPNQLIPLSDDKRAKLECLLKRSYCNDGSALANALTFQITSFYTANVRAELECLTSIARSYLVSSYLVTKILKARPSSS